MTAAILPLRPAAAMLTAAEVELRVARIRDALAFSLRELASLREQDAHLVAGYPTWHEACEAWFGDLRSLRLTGSAEARQEREALILSLRATGAPTRAIRERLGVSADAVATALRDRDPAPATLLGADGRERAARTGRQAPQEPQAAPTGRVWQQAAEWLRRAAEGELRGHERGLTLRELAALAGWSEGKASGALSDLLRRQLAERIEERRAGYRLHCHRPEPLA